LGKGEEEASRQWDTGTRGERIYLLANTFFSRVACGNENQRPTLEDWVDDDFFAPVSEAAEPSAADKERQLKQQMAVLNRMSVRQHGAHQ
jgi:hypothetical protein